MRIKTAVYHVYALAGFMSACWLRCRCPIHYVSVQNADRFLNHSCLWDDEPDLVDYHPKPGVVYALLIQANKPETDVQGFTFLLYLVPHGLCMVCTAHLQAGRESCVSIID